MAGRYFLNCKAHCPKALSSKAVFSSVRYPPCILALTYFILLISSGVNPLTSITSPSEVILLNLTPPVHSNSPLLFTSYLSHTPILFIIAIRRTCCPYSSGIEWNKYMCPWSIGLFLPVISSELFTAKS